MPQKIAPAARYHKQRGLQLQAAVYLKIVSNRAASWTELDRSSRVWAQGWSFKQLAFANQDTESCFASTGPVCSNPSTRSGGCRSRNRMLDSNRHTSPSASSVQTYDSPEQEHLWLLLMVRLPSRTSDLFSHNERVYQYIVGVALSHAQLRHQLPI